MKKQFILFLTLPVLLTGCYTYKIFPREYREFIPPAPLQTVYIVNPALKKEKEILVASGIYLVTDDSTNSTQLKLHPLKKYLACGQPVTGTMLFLGQLPSLLPDRYIFSYELNENNQPKELSFELQLATRYWFWDMFAFKKNFNQKAGKVLAGNFYNASLAVVTH